jgi:hypothetical protein
MASLRLGKLDIGNLESDYSDSELGSLYILDFWKLASSRRDCNIYVASSWPTSHFSQKQCNDVIEVAREVDLILGNPW